MRRSNTQHLSSLLKDFIQESNYRDKLREVEIIQHCHELLGKTMGRYVSQISVHNGVLYLEVTSSVVKSELMMLREEIRIRLNEKAQSEVILKVVLR